MVLEKPLSGRPAGHNSIIFSVQTNPEKCFWRFKLMSFKGEAYLLCEQTSAQSQIKVF